MNYNDQLIARVVEEYCSQTNATEWTKDEVIAWAIDNGKWKPSRKSQVELLREELNVALRAKKKVVKGGRKVRQYHCIRRKLTDGYVQTVWAHIDVATEPFMEQSIGHQRKGISGAVCSTHNTVVYWKDKNPDSKVEFFADFRDDIADHEAALAEGRSVDEDQAEFEEVGF